LVGIVLSVAVHVAALYSRGIHTPPKPMQDIGQTVVQLTLLPSIASKASVPEPIPPEPQPEKPLEIPIEPQVEQAFQPSLPAEPIAKPEPLPEPEPTPMEVAETAAVNSQEQDASLAENKGVSADAQPFDAVKPIYSRISRRRGEEGTATLSIEVLASGKAGTVSVIHSSGYSRLDEAALKAARQTTFAPAKQFGRAIDSTTELAFTFRLTDD
jgi:protein TonB